MNKKFKKLAGFLAIMMLVLSVGTMGFATSSMVNLKAYYRDIKISKNGQQVQITPEPFIVDGSTYVPLRAVSELLDKEVIWDGVNYKIDIRDMANSNVAYLTQQLYTSQLRVAQLEKQVKDLEEKLKNQSSYDLDDLEDDLNDDYYEYEGVDFDITLTGDEDDITVQIYADSRDITDDLTETKAKNYLYDIYDDIMDEFEDAEVSGYIKDDEGKLYFDFDSRGNIDLEWY